MTYSNGVYTYNFSHPSFVNNSIIHYTILVNDSTGEACNPQGVLSDTGSWKSVTYGQNATSGTTTTPGDNNTNTGTTGNNEIVGLNGTLQLSNMEDNKVTVSYKIVRVHV